MKYHIMKLKLMLILSLLACYSVVNSSAIEINEKTAVWKQLPVRLIKTIINTYGELEKRMHTLNYTQRTKPKCWWKMHLCSRPAVKPVIADHFIKTMKLARKYWEDFKRKQAIISEIKAVKTLNDLLLKEGQS